MRASRDLFDRARAASLEGRYADAAALWKTLERNNPDEAEPSLRLAHAFWQLGQIHDARESIRRGMHRTSAKPESWCRSAELLALVDCHEDSIQFLRKAIETDPTSIRAWRLLAVALERVNRLEEAREVVSQALGIDEHDPQVRLTSARLLRRASRGADAAITLEQLLNSKALPHGLRVAAHYEHAASLDACGRYEEAWDACTQAKTLLLPHAKTYRSAARRAILTHRHLAEHTTQADYARWAEQPLDPLPFRLTFLVGHPRSGTTLVEKQLVKATGALDIDEQPFLDTALGRLFTSEPVSKDPVERLRNATRAELQRARLTYVATLGEFAAEDLSGRLVIDKHPEMIRYLPYLTRVFPEASIIVVHRNIRDVVLSCYMLPVSLGPVSVDYLQVDTATNRYHHIRAGYDIIAQRLAAPPIVVAYEQFVKQPESELQRLIEATGWASGQDVCEDRLYHPLSLVRSPSYAAPLGIPDATRVERWRNYPMIASIV